MVKVGMVGLGYWGKNILRNLYEMEVLHMACDSDPQTIESRKKEFPDVNYTPYFENIIADPEINAVVIATPAATHYELVSQALNAGKDVLVEKPLALNLKHGRELVDLAKEGNRILMVGHILQYHPAVIKLKELIEKGTLGDIRYIYSNRLNIGKLRVEENILWSFAPHDISVILMLVGDEPVKVGCFKAEYLNKGICDVTLSALEFKNDIKGHIFVSWLHPFKEQKLIVVGSKAMAVFDDLTKEKLFIYPHKIEWNSGNIPIAYKAEHYSVEVEKKEPLKEELRHFIECASRRITPKTDGEEGLRVLRVLEEAENSTSYEPFPMAEL
ncbi:MAG: Gfo/Idh/MocA family oxidoreductase [Candidatus Omnitrophica bacterium]|nr:Gfo/Idh/MocA family oxidoreductase [Candidatus Omnitrophota bacterium]